MSEWNRIEEGVIAASELAGSDRAVWLDEYCGADVELRREIESLLEHESDADSFLEQPAALPPTTADVDLTKSAGKEFGPYKVVRRLGRGGMGSVYLAVRSDHEFNKRVAIKVLRRGMDTEDVLRRFRQERQILAALEHPNIARLLDGGMSADGRPYFAMEYVEGEALDRYCDEHKLGMNERLQLFLKVCGAVSYAHQNLVVHRDLKPSNILITRDREPKLLDFGIAKFLNPELSAQTISPTATFVRLLTPEYASPEQIRGRHITTVSDVYSLGVVLYKLLTGRSPHRFENTTPREIERVVCEAEPSRPSDVIRLSASSNSADGTHSTPALGLGDSLRGDLDNIILTALRKEPERRYRSVDEFAADIRRYLGGRPVSARKSTIAYRARKFVLRNKLAVTAAGVVLFAVLGGLAVSIWQTSVARRERNAADSERTKAEKMSHFLSAALAYSDPSAAAAGSTNKRGATITEMLDEFAPKIAAELADQPEVQASLHRTVGEAYHSQLNFAAAERYLSAALETQERLYGPTNRETALTLVSVAANQAAKGQYVEAEATLGRAAAMFREISPADEVLLAGLARALNLKGSVHWTRGDYNASESAHAEALEVGARITSTRQPIADSKLGLGGARYAKGRLDEAVGLLREAVDEYRKIPHLRWKLPEALNLLGQVLTWKGQYGEALSVLSESERISIEIWGKDSFPRARSLYLRVFALCFQGDCREADSVLAETERIHNTFFPDNQVARANNFDARNIIYTRTGRAAHGEQFGRRAVELYTSTMYRGAASITLARLHLAESLVAQNKFDEAERTLVEAYADAADVQGRDHWRTVNVAEALAELYSTTGRPEMAEKYK